MEPKPEIKITGNIREDIMYVQSNPAQKIHFLTDYMVNDILKVVSKYDCKLKTK